MDKEKGALAYGMGIQGTNQIGSFSVNSC